ncbi:MAG: NUDIX hydrolase [Nitrospiraceae bacterium]|nr:NUDIX hydrolase [Nitrospiraceae bacterium]
MAEERLISSERMYTGKVLKLDLDTVELPNGKTTTLEILRHPGASAVVPLTSDGRVVLIRQLRHAAGGFIYEIPAGKLDHQEDPTVCAARELEEEVGYCAGTLTLLTSIWTAPGFTDEVIHIYQASDLQRGKQHLDHDEVLEVVEWPLEVALSKIHDGTIRDAKTIIGLQLAGLNDRRVRQSS